jgi:hypothetical protein
MLSKTEFSEYKEGAASLISHGHDNGYMSLWEKPQGLGYNWMGHASVYH